MSPRQVFGDDIDPGDEIGPLLKHPDAEAVQRFMVSGMRPEMGGGVNRFTDSEAASREGLSGPILPGYMGQAYLAQLITDWMGPHGRLKSLDVTFRRPIRHGDDLRCIGLITDKRDEDGMTRVHLDVFIEDARGDRPTQGVAEVLVPTRAPEAADV